MSRKTNKTSVMAHDKNGSSITSKMIEIGNIVNIKAHPDIWTILATISAVVVIIIMFINAIQMKESLSIMKNQLKEQENTLKILKTQIFLENRPYVCIEGSSKRIKESDNPFDYLFVLKNTGKTVAENVYISGKYIGSWAALKYGTSIFPISTEINGCNVYPGQEVYFLVRPDERYPYIKTEFDKIDFKLSYRSVTNKNEPFVYDFTLAYHKKTAMQWISVGENYNIFEYEDEHASPKKQQK